jgi:small GTP-binding protein
MSATSRVKLVAVGDDSVGKTTFLWVSAKKEILSDSMPQVFDNFVLLILFNEKTVALQLWDTSSQADLEKIRVRSCPNTHVLLLCFSVCDPTSLANLPTKLVETKNYVMCPGQLASARQAPITSEEGKTRAKQMGAIAYFECNALQPNGVQAVNGRTQFSDVMRKTGRRSGRSPHLSKL